MKKEKQLSSSLFDRRQSIITIAFGVIVFLLRYAPLVNIKIGPISQWMSVSESSKVCGTLFGGLMGLCNWVQPLNIVMIVLAILLVVWGIYGWYNAKE